MDYLIYKLTCTISNKSYVGLTKNLPARLRDHRKQASGCKALRAAIAKHGWDSFTVTTLEVGLTKDQAAVREAASIVEHASRYPTGYNLTPGGENPSYVMTEEHRRKISAAHQGKTHTEESKHRMRTGQSKRSPPTDQQRARKAATMASPEYKAKIAYRQTPEYREACRQRMLTKSCRASEPTAACHDAPGS